MKIPVPPLPEQKRFIKAIETLETEIITAAPAKKEAILKKYL